MSGPAKRLCCEDEPEDQPAHIYGGDTAWQRAQEALRAGESAQHDQNTASRDPSTQGGGDQAALSSPTASGDGGGADGGSSSKGYLHSLLVGFTLLAHLKAAPRFLHWGAACLFMSTASST